MKNILFFFLFAFQTVSAQNNESDLFGLWEITKVTVGTEDKTPIAKWIEFKSDHTHLGGNGWVQHSIGSWAFDKNNSSLKIHTSNGVTDLFEPFKVVFNKNEMTWEREEEGMEVKVFIKKINEIPVAYSDKMIGLWEVDSIQTEVNEFLFNKNTKIFIRMDRRYSIINTDGRKNGVWHSHPHRQQVRLLSDKGDAHDTEWTVSFVEKTMVWENKKDGIAKLVFKRIHGF